MIRKLLVAFLAILPSVASAESWVNRVQVTSPVVGQYMAGIDAKGIPILESFGAITPTLDNFVGDSGSGGTKGVVPAPGAGDAAANKFLKADGTWATTPLSTPVLTKSQELNYQTGTTYTVLSSDNNKLVVFNNNSTINVTVPQATGSFGAGYWVDIHNMGSGLVVLYPQASVIQGLSPYIVPQGYSVRLVSDGTNYFTNGFNPRNGRVLLRTFTANSSAFLGDPSIFDGNFANYDIEVDWLITSSNTANVLFQVYAGGTYQGSNYLSTASCTRSDGYLLHCGGSAAGILMNYNTWPPVTNKMFGKMTIHNPTTGVGIRGIQGKLSYQFSSYFMGVETSGFWNNNTSVTGFRVVPTAGLLTWGVIKVYGYN